MPDSMSDPLTWRAVAGFYPEFVQWIVQTYGPLPEGEVDPVLYTQYRTAWDER